MVALLDLSQISTRARALLPGMVREFADASAEGDAVETSSAGPSDHRKRFARFGRLERSDEDRAHVAARVGERPVELDAADLCACACRPKARAVRRSSTVCASGSRNSSCGARNYRRPTLQRPLLASGLRAQARAALRFGADEVRGARRVDVALS